MSTIVNAAPMPILRGTDDQSTRALVAEPEVLPTHLPMVYLYTKKGPETPQLVVGGSRSLMYGEESFDLRSKFATHATVYSNTFNSQANAQMIQRVRPADAGPNASLRLSLDVLQLAALPLYERNADGSFRLDEDGLKIPTGETTPGLRAKWVVDVVAPDVNGDPTFGIGAQSPGTQVDQATSTQSVKYPIMDLEAPYFGADGNNYGVRIFANTTQSNSPLDDRIVANDKVFPFRMACVYRATELSTPRVVETQSAEQFVEVSFKRDSLNTATDQLLYVGDRFIQSYQDLDSLVNPPMYGPFGQVHVYDANVKTILDLAYAAETPFFTDDSDFTGEADEEYRFNLISGVSSNNVPYESYELINTGNDAVRLAEASTQYARGGSDGTMNEQLFGELVAELVTDFANPNSVLMDSARYPVSIIYDSGFPLATKYALCSFIAQRKDTAVVLATHDVLGIPLTASQDSAMAVALRTRLQMYPESEYFGTPCMRGMIVGRSGKLLQSQYTKALPLSLEIARKAAAYMGASNGRWKPGFAFDAAPASQVDMFNPSTVNVTYTPAPVRNKDWDAGLNWVQSFQRRTLFFPALKTVYDNDTSVLNSFFTMMACVELEKVGERAWRQFTGSANLTNAQLIERVNQFIIDNTLGRFDDRFVIRPDTYFTEADLARGYSWSMKITIYAPNMKTVGVLSLEARRIEDLAEA